MPWPWPTALPRPWTRLGQTPRKRRANRWLLRQAPLDFGIRRVAGHQAVAMTIGMDRDVDEVRALGVDVPIVPGIMPIVGFTKLARFSDACGAEIPRWMRKKFESFGDDTDAIRAFGLDVVTELCERLIKGGAPGLHFYFFFKDTATTEICRRLG